MITFLYSLMLIVFAYYVKSRCDDIDNSIDDLEERTKELESFLLDYEECVENEIGTD